MAKQETFKVSQKGVEPVVASWNKPENIDDPQWAALGVDKAGINELACQSLVIKIQGIGRDALPDKAKVQAAVDGYKYGQRAKGTRTAAKPKLAAAKAKEAKFTPEQLKMLSELGVEVEGVTPASAPAEAAPAKNAKA